MLEIKIDRRQQNLFIITLKVKHIVRILALIEAIIDDSFLDNTHVQDTPAKSSFPSLIRSSLR